jgi:hypothetical protein
LLEVLRFRVVDRRPRERSKVAYPARRNALLGARGVERGDLPLDVRTERRLEGGFAKNTLGGRDEARLLWPGLVEDVGLPLGVRGE